MVHWLLSSRYLPGDLFRVKQLQRDVEYVHSDFKRIIDEHRLSADTWREPSDYIYAYLKKMKEEEKNKESTFTGLWKEMKKCKSVMAGDSMNEEYY